MSDDKKPFKKTAKYEANNRYIKKNYKQVKLSMPNDEADTLKAYCESEGISVAGMIRGLVKEKINQDLEFDFTKSDYMICVRYPNSKTEIIKKYPTKDAAMEDGKKIFAESEKGTTVSCIKGNIGEDGQVTGKYLLYKHWS